MPITAIANIGWRFYIIFAVLNFSWFPIVWYFYIETKGLSLEEVDLMFKIKYHGGKSMTYKEAAVLAKKEADVVRLEATRREVSLSDGKQGIQHEEGLFAETKLESDGSLPGKA